MTNTIQNLLEKRKDSQISLTINISMPNPQMPELKRNLVDRNLNRMQLLAKALKKRDETSVVDRLISKLRETPLYVKTTSQHIGGSV
jgi:dihydroorotate dehydrogenase